MIFLRHPLVPLILGIFAIVALAAIGARTTGTALADRLAHAAQQALATVPGAGSIRASFISPSGLPSRHPVLSGGEGVKDSIRARAAKAVAAVPGVGGIRWADGDARAIGVVDRVEPLHCQEDVQFLLRARTIRFEESSARIDAGSQSLVDEVATALRPCLGSIIAITGHTDASGPEPGNLALSRERAMAVQQALLARGIPDDGIRVRGVGSSEPAEGLPPSDPANRRIEFSVIATDPIHPTPVDTPGPR
ncbi:OmpA family protein [Altererythrobacter xixiisoli]|uniref:OmpA family protein n=1 Tax=Croceibacterium xixiisoli TaxID=1476466 RepID=A0A6I4TSX4_9SPHN|nr:OmpA family protein [Croceibacterium xixiisoli]MXO99245.1 OmpA family protein [Croceibacterium xixiisoli]